MIKWIDNLVKMWPLNNINMGKMDNPCLNNGLGNFRPGEHIPLRTVDIKGKTIEVFCQECGTPMVERSHREYIRSYSKWFEKEFGEPYKRYSHAKDIS